MFERRSFEQLTRDMIDWSRGVSTKLTDYRPGSRIRTIYEAVAIIIESYYDMVYKEIKQLVEQNLYAVFDFSRLPAVHTTGIVTFSRDVAASEDYLIAAGTLVLTEASSTTPPIQFRTTADALLATGTTAVDVPVICTQAGTLGNIGSSMIVDFLTKPAGIETVTNGAAFTTGADEETKEAQKYRFHRFLASRMRGIKEAIEYGALTASLVGINGEVTERVVQSVAFEFIEDNEHKRLGEIDLYIWNGVGEPSPELIAEVTKVEIGYYDADGTPVYGYKPAGVVVNIYTATTKKVYIQLAVTTEDWTTLDDLKVGLEEKITEWFSALALGQTLVQTALEAKLKGISGVADIKLGLSTDGSIFTADNVTAQCVAGDVEIIRASMPIEYI